jgi:hypothetical protein
MYLLGHTDSTLTMSVYEQVMNMGEAAVPTLERVLGCPLEQAFALLSGRRVLSTKRPPAKKNASQPRHRDRLGGGNHLQAGGNQESG